jgi:hypothetical protein
MDRAASKVSVATKVTVGALSRANRLKPEENEQLLEGSTTDEMLVLVLRGLRRVSQGPE